MKNLFLLCSFTFCCFVKMFGQVTPPPPPPPPPPMPSAYEEEIFKIVEEMPRFPGCEEITDRNERKNCSIEKMKSFIDKNLIYPKAAMENGVEGTTVVRFYVDKDGVIKEPKLVRDIGAGCGQAAVDVVNKMNDMDTKWLPGKQRGKRVNVYFNLPIKFKLPKNQPAENASFKDQEIEEEVIKSKDEKSVIDTQPKKEKKAFKKVDEMPRFPGCEDVADEEERKACSQKKMLEFIYKNVKYPGEARENGVEGTVVIRYIIQEDGSIAQPEIIKNIGAGCGEEALRVVNLMNDMPEKWIAGKQQGENVDVFFNLPVKFRLEKSKKKKKKNSNRRN